MIKKQPKPTRSERIVERFNKYFNKSIVQELQSLDLCLKIYNDEGRKELKAMFGTKTKLYFSTISKLKELRWI